jgi:hypothetical protein
VREVVDVAVDEDVARLGRERGQRAVEQLGELRALQLALEVEVVGELAGRVFGCGRQVAAASPGPAQADIARDRGDPPLGARRIVELVRVPPRLEERLLREVLGRVAVAGEDGAEPNQPPPLAVVPEPLCRRVRHVRVQSRLGRETQRRFSRAA